MRKSNKKVAPVLELRKKGDESFQLYKNGKAHGKKYLFKDEEHFDFDDEFFDVPCCQIPEGDELQTYINEGTIDSWIRMIDITRKKNKLHFGFFASLGSDARDTYYYLSKFVVLKKIFMAAAKYGFVTDGNLNEDEPYATIYKEFKSDGTLREKITESIKILNRIRTQAEKEIIAKLRNRNLYCIIKDTE